MPSTPSQTGLLLSGSDAKWQRSLRTWLADPLAPTSLTAPLLLLTFVNAVLDAASYGSLHVFSSCQTGNFVTFSIKATGNGPTGNEVQGRLGAVVASLLAFIAAGFIFGHLGHAVGDRARGWLLTSLVWQTTFVAVASILVSADVIHTSSGLNWVLVMLFSLAGGAQVAMAKGCGNPLISTAILTSPLIDTFGNRDLLRPRGLPAGRRRNLILQWLYLATFLAGAFLGGGLFRKWGALPVFWISVGLRLATTLWIVLLRREEAEDAKPTTAPDLPAGVRAT